MGNKFLNNQSKDQQALYIELLMITGSLSRLFSDSENPFLYYRAAENIFCKAFDAENLSRGDVSADAMKGKLGIGLKTFLHNNGKTFQKVAEFNRESFEFRGIEGLELILKMADMRNERIRMTKRTFYLENMIYHLVTRNKNKMSLFEEDMDEIDIDSIIVHNNPSKNTILFSDRYNEYSFSLSKNTLSKRFIMNDDKSLIEFPVNIYEDPFDFLLRSKKELLRDVYDKKEALDYVILPLYSPASGDVELKSGLNAWNAAPRTKGGRNRDRDEVYIIVPTWIHNKKPGFFNYVEGMALKDIPHFEFILPNGGRMTAKLVQQNGKAINSTPLTALGKWILRDVLNLKPGELVTRHTLNKVGIDSIKLTKISELEFLLDFKETGAYCKFEYMFLKEGK